MDLLGIVQSLHYEGKQPGDPPATVVGQTGRAGDLVRWAVEAYNDIQREHNGRWKWLRGAFNVDTVAGTASYAYGDCTDTDTAAAISRFRTWDLDDATPPLIYLVSDGQSTQREMYIRDWPTFRTMYVRASSANEDGYPGDVSEDAGGKLYVGPTPDDVYRIDGNYWKANQTLAVDADIPEMPPDYHMLVVYRALLKYGFTLVDQAILARVQYEGTELEEALEQDQLYSGFTIATAGALA